MRFLNRFIVFFITVSAFTFTRKAEAGCGSSVCPLDFQTVRENRQGSFQLGYEFEYINLDQPRIGDRSASVGEISGHHDEVFTRVRIHRLSASAGITDRLHFGIRVPVQQLQHQHLHHHQGAVLTDEWEYTAMADMSADFRYVFGNLQDPFASLFTVILGGKLPTGAQHVHSHDHGNGTTTSDPEPGIMPGNGSWDARPGISWLRKFSVPMIADSRGTMPVFASSYYRINGKTKFSDYRLGNVFEFNTGIIYPLLARIGLITQINFLAKARDEKGSSTEDVSTTGGEFLYVSPGLQFKILDELQAQAVVQIPVWQRVNVIQLVSDYNLMFSVNYRFQI